jgi:hypothetical protein
MGLTRANSAGLKYRGRRYLDQVVDAKDYQPVLTLDMSYLVYRELLYPPGDWL